MKRSRGFTLIELMITLVLAAIILTLAVPGFQDIIRNNRAATQANELVTALGLARSEAVKRGARVSLCPSTDQASCIAGPDWSSGWIVFVDGAANDLAAPVVLGDPIRAWGPLVGNSQLTGPDNVRFRPLGDVIDNEDFQHRIPGCGAGEGRNIEINAVGRALVTRVDC